jgi:5'(3')-deoxyribonucleotidase
VIIYLDMDGVVSDAHRAFLKAIDREDLLKDYPAGEFDIHKAAGVPEKTVWRKVAEAGRELWSEMRVLPWAHDLYEELGELGDVVFLTSPSWDPDSLAGKLEWLQRFTNKKDFRDYIMTNRKKLLAGPDAVLIDDRLENCEKFRDAGGKAILFPAAWQGRSEDDIWEALPLVIANVERWVNSGDEEGQEEAQA